MEKTTKYDLDRIFRLFLSIGALAAFFFLIYYLRTVLIPFAIAFIIAYLLDPVVDFFDNMKMPRILSILIVFALIGMVFFVVLFYGIPYIYNELISFGEVLPNYIENFYSFVQEKISIVSDETFTSGYFNTIYTGLLENIESSGFIQKILGYLTNIFSQIFSVFYILVGVVIVIMYVFFLLRDIDRIKERWEFYIPERYRESVKLFLREVYYYTSHFFRGQLTIVSILGVMFAIGFSIVDIRLSIIVGLMAGFLNLVPNFGTLIAIVPALLLAVGRAAEDGSDPLIRIGGILIVFLVVQAVQDIILVPTIMGKKTGLRPVTILISVLIWGKLLGFLGIILAIPLTCLTKVYFSRFILKEEIITDLKPTE